MNRRRFLLGVFAAAGGGTVLSTSARAPPAQSLWDELQHMDANGVPPEDLPAQGAQETQGRRVCRVCRVCRVVRNRRGFLVRRCWRRW